MVKQQSGCEPTPEWRKGITLSLGQMGGDSRVLGNSKLYEIFDKEQGRVSELATSARTVSDCAVAQAAFDKLKGKLGY